MTKQGRRYKRSSLDTWTMGLRQIKAEFGDRALPPSPVPKRLCGRNGSQLVSSRWRSACSPLRWTRSCSSGTRSAALCGRARGRADEDPPTPDEFDRLLDACDALGRYADQMRALMVVGAYTGMRPGELFALEWADIDLAAHRIHVRRRVYGGELDLPKSNRERTIALPPPARDVLLRQPTRALPTVFATKTGRRMSQPTLSG